MEERKQIPNDATSRKVAKAAILMAISDSREEERRLKEEKNAEGPKDAEPAPETAPQEETAEAVKDAASPVPAESATVEEDTDGAGK